MVDPDQVRKAISIMAAVLRAASEDIDRGTPDLLASAKDRVEWVAKELEIAAGERTR